MWENTFGTYKFRLVLLDDISVLPLVLLHPQLGVFHINVVCKVIHYTERTQTSIKGPVNSIRSACHMVGKFQEHFRHQNGDLSPHISVTFHNRRSNIDTHFSQTSCFEVRQERATEILPKLSFLFLYYSLIFDKCNTMYFYQERLFKIWVQPSLYE